MCSCARTAGSGRYRRPCAADVDQVAAYRIADLATRACARPCTVASPVAARRSAATVGGRAGVRRHAALLLAFAAVRPPRPLRRRQPGFLDAAHRCRCAGPMISSSDLRAAPGRTHGARRRVIADVTRRQRADARPSRRFRPSPGLPRTHPAEDRSWLPEGPAASCDNGRDKGQELVYWGVTGSFRDAGLPPGVPYHYTVFARHRRRMVALEAAAMRDGCADPCAWCGRRRAGRSARRRDHLRRRRRQVRRGRQGASDRSAPGGGHRPPRWRIRCRAPGRARHRTRPGAKRSVGPLGRPVPGLQLRSRWSTTLAYDVDQESPAPAFRRRHARATTARSTSIRASNVASCLQFDDPSRRPHHAGHAQQRRSVLEDSLAYCGSIP